MSDAKMYLLKLDSADMALIVGSLAALGCMSLENGEIVRATFDEVKFQLQAQGLNAQDEMLRQKELYEERKAKG